MTALIVIGALVLSCAGGVLIVPAVLALAPAKAGPRAKAADLLRGGLVIGILERLAITGGLLAGRPEVTGIVLAIKGLGRYPEIRNAATVAQAGPQLASPSSSTNTATEPADPALGAAVSERFIIGTLASYLWAGICGVVAIWILARVG